MRRTFILLALVISLAGCVTTGKPVKDIVKNPTCPGDPKGHTRAEVSYRADNKFEVSMKLKWDAGENTEFRIKLKAHNGSETVTVKTIGVSGTLPGGASTPFAWLNGNGSEKGSPDSEIVLCVPSNVPVGTEYKFDVDVAGIGKIDPRVEVTW